MKCSDSAGSWFTVLALSLATLFVATRPAHAQTETVLYSFCSQSNCTDGAYPQSRLTSDGAGNFYGTTWEGGMACAGAEYGCGTVFELSPNGSGGWDETVLYSFTGGEDGANPLYSYVLFDSLGNLYGTTNRGGTNGAGVVFELSPMGKSWKEIVLYNFCSQKGCTDGSAPENGLIMDTAGNLYGVTAQGGSDSAGTVFELSPSGGDWTEQVIYPYGSLTAGLTMDNAGNIFGVLVSETESSLLLIELSPNGEGGLNPNVIYDLGSRRHFQASTPVLDNEGNIYGTSSWASHTGGPGNVYKLSLVTKGKKKGEWAKKTLYSFKSGYPWPGIVFDAAGNIYGATFGGNSNDGTVFELVANGKSSYQENTLWYFNGMDGDEPYASPILDSATNLYGTTSVGGAYGYGTVFEVTP
jgi:uncharacterized repeat protein (TIGR03803 family)